MLRRVVPRRLVADVACQITRRVDGRVEQHRRAARHGRDIRCIEAAQRRADDSHRLARPCVDAVHDHVHRFARRGRQLRAPPLHAGVALRHPLGHQACLHRLGRRAETVQVEEVGGGHRTGAVIASGFWQ